MQGKNEGKILTASRVAEQLNIEGGEGGKPTTITEMMLHTLSAVKGGSIFFRVNQSDTRLYTRLYARLYVRLYARLYASLCIHWGNPERAPH